MVAGPGSEPVRGPRRINTVLAGVRLFGRLSRRAWLPEGVHPHALRHAFTSNAADAGAVLDEIADLLGHANPSSSQVYHRRPGKPLASAPRQTSKRSPAGSPSWNSRSTSCPALRRTGRWPDLSSASPTAPPGPGDTNPPVIRSTGGNSHAGPGGQRPSCRTAKNITGVCACSRTRTASVAFRFRPEWRVGPPRAWSKRSE
ncbi:tyrosine-type recombinase/integrase [Streptomyces sp. NPDC058741]|uniref:tyrosine-type recombinase/integrase n=1 Tax=Streptomyces sp. NPDC058741 TaxID=3346620 RepID=UPI0036AF8825